MSQISTAANVARRERVSKQALDQLFREARTHTAWLPIRLPDNLLREIYDLARFGPTSANSCPARFVFLITAEAEERLRPALAPGNVQKTMSAPVTVIIAWDIEFYEQLPRLFPHVDAHRNRRTGEDIESVGGVWRNGRWPERCSSPPRSKANDPTSTHAKVQHRTTI